MVRIFCDICRKEKILATEQILSESWVLGYNLQLENLNGSRHYLRFLERWDDARVLEPGAVHLCSPRCKDDYVVKCHAA